MTNSRWAEEETWHDESQWDAEMKLWLIAFLTFTVPWIPGLWVARVWLVKKVIPEVPVGASLDLSFAFFLKMIFPSLSPRMPYILPFVSVTQLLIWGLRHPMSAWPRCNYPTGHAWFIRLSGDLHCTGPHCSSFWEMHLEKFWLAVINNLLCLLQTQL